MILINNFALSPIFLAALINLISCSTEKIITNPFPSHVKHFQIIDTNNCHVIKTVFAYHYVDETEVQIMTILLALNSEPSTWTNESCIVMKSVDVDRTSERTYDVSKFQIPTPDRISSDTAFLNQESALNFVRLESTLKILSEKTASPVVPKSPLDMVYSFRKECQGKSIGTFTRYFYLWNVVNMYERFNVDRNYLTSLWMECGRPSIHILQPDSSTSELYLLPRP